jgi:hypothetical protein
MWAIDAYRIAGIPPAGMGKQTDTPAARLGAVYRAKGNWFATALSLLLQNRTDEVIKPRIRVRGFSQLHQIDLAWPVREKDPLVCVESKVTGAPAYSSYPIRSAMADFSNRRKELKFAATDLKLYRRQQHTSINHWGVWREKAPPKTYFLWAARLKTEGRGQDSVTRLVAEAQSLINSYLDGAGLVAWRLNPTNTGYETVPIGLSGQVTSLDDVLYRIESEIKDLLLSGGGSAPPPVVPAETAVDVEALAPDANKDSS